MKTMPLGSLAQRILDGCSDLSHLARSEHERLRLQLVQRTVDKVLSGTTWIGSAELGSYRHEPSGCTALTIEQWLDAGRIFAIRIKGDCKIPVYALDDQGEPARILKPILDALRGRGGFQVAAFFESPSSMLDGKRPRDILHDAGADVLAAAQAHMSTDVDG
jgi:hypothetical protein